MSEITMDEFEDVGTGDDDRCLARAVRDHVSLDLWCVMIAALKVEASRCGLVFELVVHGDNIVRPERWLLDRLGASIIEARRRHLMPFAEDRAIRVTPREVVDGSAYVWASTMIRALEHTGLDLAVSNAAEFTVATSARERHMADHLNPERGVISVRASSAVEAYRLAVEQRKAANPENAADTQPEAAAIGHDGL